MSIETPVVEAPVTVVAPKTKAKPKATTKPAKDRPIIRGEKTEDGRRKTLRNPQIELLTALSKSKTGSLNRKQLAEKCPGVGLSEHLGSIYGEPNKYTVSLIEHKYVKQEQHDVDGKDVMIYTITASGKKALEKAG